MKARRWSALMCAGLVGALTLGATAFAREGQRGHGREGPRKGALRAGPGMGKAHEGGMGAMLMMRKDLDLTEEQAQKIRELSSGRKEKAAAARQKVSEARKALHEAVAAQDEKAIQETAAKLGTAIADMAVLHAGLRTEMRKLLTPEQIKKLDASRAARQKAMEQRREQWEKRRTERRGNRAKDARKE